MRAGKTLVSVVVLVSLCGCEKVRMERAERNVLNLHAARQLYRVLSLYEEENGALPHSPEGPEHALYVLKDYVGRVPRYPHGDFTATNNMDVEDLELPYPWLGDGAAYWDVDGQELMDGDYDYLNEPIALNRESPERAVYATRVDFLFDGRWVVFENGAALWVSRANPYHDAPLGRTMDELQAAEPDENRKPDLRLTFDQWHDQGSHQERIAFAVYRYAEDHGAVPLSPAGGAYALYELRDYVPDAGAFDALYTRLENGAAYWDHENKRVGNADFEYLNEPLTLAEKHRWQDFSEPIVLLAEKWGVGRLYSRQVTFGGGWLYGSYVRRDAPHADDPLGRTRSELEIGP